MLFRPCPSATRSCCNCMCGTGLTYDRSVTWTKVSLKEAKIRATPKTSSPEKNRQYGQADKKVVDLVLTIADLGTKRHVLNGLGCGFLHAQLRQYDPAGRQKRPRIATNLWRHDCWSVREPEVRSASWPGIRDFGEGSACAKHHCPQMSLTNFGASLAWHF